MIIKNNHIIYLIIIITFTLTLGCSDNSGGTSVAVKTFTISNNGHLIFNGDMGDLKYDSNTFKAYDMQTEELTQEISIRDSTIFITDTVGNEFKGRLFKETNKNMDCLYADRKDRFGSRKYSICRPITNITVTGTSYSDQGKKYESNISKGELFFMDHDMGGGLSGYGDYKFYRFLKQM